MKRLHHLKKCFIGEIAGIAIGMVTVFVSIFVAMVVGSQLNDDNTQAIYTSVMNMFGTWTPIIVLVGLGSVLLGIIYKRITGEKEDTYGYQ